jgi:stage III sporulation protein AA
VNIATEYSPWTAGTAAYGYVTTLGGHRIGICGEAIIYDGKMRGVRRISSLCIRIARDIPFSCNYPESLCGSVLIIGRPGSGKTTLLRDLIRKRSDSGQHITVIDEREELFPRTKSGFGFTTGACTDVLSGCPKSTAMEAVLRCMGPDVIAVDEITAAEDCSALLHAGWCGVSLLATAHAGDKYDLFNRPVYKPILDARIFSSLIILKPDKSWTAERIDI